MVRSPQGKRTRDERFKPYKERAERWKEYARAFGVRVALRKALRDRIDEIREGVRDVRAFCARFGSKNNLRGMVRDSTQAVSQAMRAGGTSAIRSLYGIRPVETLTLAPLRTASGTPLIDRLGHILMMVFVFLILLVALVFATPLLLVVVTLLPDDPVRRFHVYFFGLALLPSGALGVFAAALIGLLGGEVTVSRGPDEGIRGSGANAVRFGIIGWLIFPLVIVPIGILTGTSLLPTSYDPLHVIAYSWFGALVGATFGMTTGGYAYLQHRLLRLVLRLSSSIPANYERFLEAMVRQRLLRKAGGAYEFLHPLLQQHFAARHRVK
jgi:hypothetical protein